MNMSLCWEKEQFKNCYSIYDQGLNVGCLEEKSFCRHANARLKHNCIKFKTSGFFQQRTIIKDAEGKVIGNISYNYLKSTAKIVFKENYLMLKNLNLWNYHWEVTDFNGTTIRYHGTTDKGNIETTKDDKALILLGLFAINLFSQSKISFWILIMTVLWVNFIMLIQ